MNRESSSDLHPTPPKASTEAPKGNDSALKSPRNGRICAEPQDGIAIDKISVGDLYDMLDSSSRWCEGKVVKIDRNGNTVYVQYLYWDSRYDEWISADRLAPLHAHTFTENGTLKKGQRVEVLDEIRVWRESFVIDETDTQVREVKL